MSSSPVVIRRAPLPFHQHQQKPLTPPFTPSSLGTNGDHLSSTPSEKHHFYGSTPGGTRIVYSREQLLTLASSPLSAQHQSAFHLPNEISRSPDKEDPNAGFKTVHYHNGNGHGGSGGRRRQQQPSPNRVKGISPNRAAHPAPLAFNHGAVNATSPHQSREAGTFGRSPHSAPPTNVSVGISGGGSSSSSKPRSPGSAFNFAKGPIANGNRNPTSFKERLEAASAAAAKQQKKERGEEDENGADEETFEIEL